MNTEKLFANVVDVIEEGQLKLGYRPETIRLYYPLNSLNLFLGTQLDAQGMMDTLAAFAAQQGQVVGKKKSYGGLAIVTKLTAISRITAEIISRGAGNTDKGGAKDMEGEVKYNLIFISVNQGYSEMVMKTAKKAGATGGTVMRGRLAGQEMLEGYDETEVTEEREIISILAPVSVCKEIMENVNAEFGLSSKAKGTVFALPVEKAFKI